MKHTVHKFQYGRHRVRLETGLLAQQATAAVLAQMDDTVVLVSVVVSPSPKAGVTFLPLSVHYQERSYAAGKIPGSFFRREGRPGEGEVLISRLIDRTIRPLFPKGFAHEVQVIVSLLSVEADASPDVVSMIGVSAALARAGLPLSAPFSASRIGYASEQFILNPSAQAAAGSTLDLMVSCKRDGILMVEASAKELDEATLLAALEYAHQAQQPLLKELATFVAMQPPCDPWAGTLPEVSPLSEEVNTHLRSEMDAIYALESRTERVAALASLRKNRLEDDDTEAYHAAEKSIIRQKILDEGLRFDGRKPETIRALDVRTGVLPRTHGSALFTRGETQALVTVTLGSEREAKSVECLIGDRTDPLMVHYNFLPFCVGEIGPLGSPKRREIGHGALMKKGISAVMPALSTFPYTVRVVSEITSSNGSSSMASLCGASLALMDAGVPITSAVAGVAMGLVKGKDRYVVLSDINAMEDSLGDMDFKVAGSMQGITALQMDIKVPGVTREILSKALMQAKSSRLHILRVMNRALATPAEKLAEFAPKIHTLQILPEKIKDLIGKGGAVVRKLSEETGAKIDIADNGSITISATDTLSLQDVIQRIDRLTADLVEGECYPGRVSRVVEFGAFVAIDGTSKEGLVHISQITNTRVERVVDHLQVGLQVKVKLLSVDRQGRLKLSMKDAEPVQDDLQSTVDSVTATDEEVM